MKTSYRLPVVLLVACFTTSAVMAANPLGGKLLKGLKKIVDKKEGGGDDEKKGKEKGEGKEQAEKPAAGPKVPIVLDQWGRYHTNIVTFENPGKKDDGTTDYQKIAWVPQVKVVVQVADPEQDDVVIIQHYKGDEKWGDVIKVQPDKPQIIKRKGKNYHLVAVNHTMDKEQGISETGTFSMKVGYKQTGAGKLHEDLATFTYTVKEYVRGWTSQGKIMGYYVDHDFRMGEAWLYRNSDGHIELWSWFKYDREGGQKVQGGRMRGYCGDTKFDFLTSPTRRTENKYVYHVEKNKTEQVVWGLWYWRAPKVNGVPAAEFLSKHPGDCRCVLTQDGEVSREFHFTVDKDGEIVRKPFDGDKTIYAVEDSFPLKMELKTAPDLKFDPEAFKKHRFYSRK